MARRQKWLTPVATAAILVAVLVAVAWVPRLGAIPSSASQCAAAKIEAAEKKVSAILRCVRRAVKAGQEVSGPCVEEAMSQFTARFTAAESLGDCFTTGDADTIEAKIDSFIEELLIELLPGDFEE